jgi:PPOX class probable F420-dependent enzyme
MNALPESARELIESGKLAHLVTLNPDGSPHVTAVWVGLDGDEVITGHLGEHKKIKNVRRDPRVALSIQSDQVNSLGLNYYLVIEGTARVTEGLAADVLHRLAQVYIGEGADFPPMENAPDGYVIHIAVDRLGGVGPWTK